jgi:putative copper export protein
MNDTVLIASVALVLHSLSAVVWVGGMFFALFALRPATAPLEPGLGSCCGRGCWSGSFSG